MFGDINRAAILSNSATFVGLITLGSWISVPFVPVPLTLQTLFVLLSGAVMKRYAVIPVVLYIFLGMMGLPVFHNGLSGIGILLGPTGGYLVGFVPAALITGLCYEKASKKIHVAGLVLSTIVIYICGIAWLCWSTGIGFAAGILIGLVPFIPGDILKISAAYLIAERLP